MTRDHRVRRAALCVAVLFFSVLATAGAADDSLAVHRFGLFIGANDGGEERVRLRWAESDARKVSQVMADLGGIPPENGSVLVNPSLEELETHIETISDRVEKADGRARRSEFMLYYSGHSDETGLLLGDHRYTYRELRDAIQAVGADVSIAILDSCASGAFTRLKGGTRIQPFLVDDSSDMKGHAFLTSSSEDEAAQESDAIRSSFFTHYLVSGLRGAADLSRDRRITLNEVYQYAHAETLQQTEATFAGPQHPSYDIQLNGTGDLVLTDLTVSQAAIRFEAGVGGRLFVRDEQGNLVAEVRARNGSELSLALPAGSYRILLDAGDRSYTTEVTLTSSTETTVQLGDLRPAPTALYRTRGDSEPGDMIPDAPPSRIADAPPGTTGRSTAPESTEYVPAEEPPRKDDTDDPEAEPAVEPLTFNAHFVPGISLYPTFGRRYQTSISLGLVMAHEYRVVGGMYSGVMNLVDDSVIGFQQAGVGNIVAGDVTGYQQAGVFNIVEGETMGVQGAGVFNITEGPTSFVQGAGVFNIAEDSVSFFQGAGVFNIAEGPLRGVQAAGVFNSGREVHGAQMSVVNVAREVNGAQLGLVNVGGTVRGAQVGLVNVADDVYGVPIGLVTIVRNGIHDVGYWHDRQDRSWISFQNGTRWLYTIAYGGVSEKSPIGEFKDLAIGIGLGVRINTGFFYADIDLSAKHPGVGETPEERLASAFTFDERTFPSLRIAGGFAFGDGLGFYLGSSFDAHIPGITTETAPYHESRPVYDFTDAGLDLVLYPKLFAGFKL